MPTIPDAFPGSQSFTRKFLRQGRLPTSLTLPYAGEVSQQFQCFLTPGQPPKNSNTSLRRCRLWTLHMRILTLVQAFNRSQANPYASTGSQRFKQFLKPVKDFNPSHANPYSCAGS
ncbi:hypothetical protein O181_013694 [Austropuccinia psidii MF-1]|uniref:Uncharacterized protein n=1 Tax=Austropuccinia psidii MF-1 TaxID=1389203 RepID=A0A9Q3GP45_9BASI|nr:hypothetical protein [Austropuccinia psidii MF-1]